MRKIEPILFKNLAVTFILVVLFLSISIFEKIPTTILTSVLLAIFISTVNFIIGYQLIKFGLTKKDQLFLIIVFGGMVFRMFLLLVIVIMCLNFLFLSQYYFIFTFFIFYFYYLIVEIYYLVQNESGSLAKK
jgi:MFS superfamily sulfate permease-like transporter